jgi:hypothetical protein
VYLSWVFPVILLYQFDTSKEVTVQSINVDWFAFGVLTVLVGHHRVILFRDTGLVGYLA